MDLDSDTAARRRRLRLPAIIILIVVANLAIGLIGGVAGFTLLSNSNNPIITNVRTRLGLGTSSSIGIPVHQTITVEESSAVIDASKKINPAVVAITVNQDVQSFFGSQSTLQETAAGSGFIVTSDGLIVTNKHVVDTAGAQYKVVLSDGRIFDATVQATDPLNDLAFVKIDAKDLPTVELGSSAALQVGQYVIAVGNALGEFQNSVSLGIISAKNRSITADEEDSSSAGESLDGLLQTDAAINPGNSGGPLVNLDGQVIGIDTAIASTTGGSVGIGFAIPVDSIKSAIDSVRKTGQVIRPYLGVRYVPVDTSLKQEDNLSVDYGALVTAGDSGQSAVVSGGPADKAGIKDGDIILDVNGDRVDDNDSLISRLSNYAVGDVVTLTVLRGGKNQDIKVTLGQAPASS